jgi:hypothetical protein
MANTTIPTARLIELETAEHERDLLRTELAGLESVRREQAAGRDYWAAECDRLRAALIACRPAVSVHLYNFRMARAEKGIDQAQALLDTIDAEIAKTA